VESGTVIKQKNKSSCHWSYYWHYRYYFNVVQKFHHLFAVLVVWYGLRHLYTPLGLFFIIYC